MSPEDAPVNSNINRDGTLAGSSTRVAHRRSDIVRSGSNRVLDPLAARSERVLMA